ncbi:MAG: hypothetical protein M3024_11460 [Candidatus Dormibacteraeota bacterium]|nr:hypothetical protein [Candidatus Dormibacteraeota bacterium]
MIGPRRLLLLALAAVAAGLAVGTPAFAADRSGEVSQDRVVWGQNFTLGAGESVSRDLTVFGGNLTAAGSVGGDLTVIGGNADVTGPVAGDVTVIGGNLVLSGNARVGRDATSIGGNVTLKDSAQVGRDASAVGGHTDVQGQATVGRDATGVPTAAVISGRPNFLLPLGAGGLVPAVGFVLLSTLLLLLFPRQLERASRLAIQQPPASFGLGCLGVVVSIVVITILAISIILSPVALVLALALAAAWAFGWAAISLALGRKILEWGRSTEARPLPALLLGAAIVAVAWMIPGINVIVALVGGTVAVGVTLGTRFGNRGAGPWSRRRFPPMAGGPGGGVSQGPLPPQAPQSPPPPAA